MAMVELVKPRGFVDWMRFGGCRCSCPGVAVRRLGTTGWASTPTEGIIAQPSNPTVSMAATNADQEYARYMLRWIDALDWPEFPLAEAELPALRSYWLQGDVADLDAIATRLWSWVDAHGDPRLSDDHRMLLARMLICVAAPESRELERRGFFEQLLRRRGVSRDRIVASGPGEHRTAWAEAKSGGADDVPMTPRLQRMKQQVLLAFAALSFVSGATSPPDPTASSLEILWIVLMAWLIYLWYRLDSEQRGFQRSPGLSAVVVLIAAVGIPWYLWQSRGPREGRLAILQALGVFLGALMLSALGASMFGTPR